MIFKKLDKLYLCPNVLQFLLQIICPFFKHRVYFSSKKIFNFLKEISLHNIYD
jgi:hypothetical protein